MMCCGDVDVTTKIGYIIFQPSYVRKISSVAAHWYKIVLQWRKNLSKEMINSDKSLLTVHGDLWIDCCNSIVFLPTNYSTQVYWEPSMSMIMSEKGSSPEFKNSPKSDCLHLLLVQQKKILHLVEVYEYEKATKNRMRGRNNPYDNGVVVYLYFLMNCLRYCVD